MITLFNFFKNILNKLLLFLQFSLVFLYIIFEEIIWDLVAVPAYRFLESFNVIQKLDIRLRSANRYVILIVFILLFVMVETVGIVAGGLIVSGKLLIGIGLYLAKIPIAVFTFWMFKVVKLQLMTFDWFRASYDMLERILDFIKNSYIYRSTINILSKTKEYIRLKLHYVKVGFLSRKSKFLSRLQRFYFFIKKRYKNN